MLNPYFSETVPTHPLTAWRHIQKESRPMHYDLCCTVNIWKSPTRAGFFGLLGYLMLTKPEQELPCSDGYLPYIIFMQFWRLYQLNLGLKWLEYHCILFIWHLMQHLNIFVCKNKESGFAWIKWNHISQARFVHRDLVVVFLSAYIRWSCASKDYTSQLYSFTIFSYHLSLFVHILFLGIKKKWGDMPVLSLILFTHAAQLERKAGLCRMQQSCDFL